MTPLQTALVDYDDASVPYRPGFVVILAAARSLAEGETIWWCEEHDGQTQPVIAEDYEGKEVVVPEVEPYECWKSAWAETEQGSGFCRMVEKILADPL